MKLRAPSPALVISFIALVVALSATAYAATTITKSSQIKNGIVTGADIKNSTIRTGDIKNGTIGTTDLSKSTLKRIDGGGSTTNSAAIEGIRKVGPLAQPPNQVVKVATLTIPAGAYVITTKTTLSGNVDPPNVLVPPIPVATAFCKLDAGGDEDQADTTTIVSGRQAQGTLYMQVARTVGGSSAITLSCASGASWSATNTSILAHRVSNTTKTAIGE